MLRSIELAYQTSTVDTFGRPLQGVLERPDPGAKALGYYLLPLRGKVGLASEVTLQGSDRLGLASEAALHEKTACSRYFSEQAGTVKDAAIKPEGLLTGD